jgi:hypothetical protein
MKDLLFNFKSNDVNTSNYSFFSDAGRGKESENN